MIQSQVRYVVYRVKKACSLFLVDVQLADCDIQASVSRKSTPCLGSSFFAVFGGRPALLLQTSVPRKWTTPNNPPLFPHVTTHPPSVCRFLFLGRGWLPGDVDGGGYPHLRQPVQPVAGAQHLQHRGEQHPGGHGEDRSRHRRRDPSQVCTLRHVTNTLCHAYSEKPGQGWTV